MNGRKPPLVIAIGKPYIPNLRGEVIRMMCSLEGCQRKAAKRLYIVDEDGRERFVWAYCGRYIDTERAARFTVGALATYVRGQNLALSPMDMARLFWAAPEGQRAEALHEILFGNSA